MGYHYRDTRYLDALIVLTLFSLSFGLFFGGVIIVYDSVFRDYSHVDPGKLSSVLKGGDMPCAKLYEEYGAIDSTFTMSRSMYMSNTLHFYQEKGFDFYTYYRDQTQYCALKGAVNDAVERPGGLKQAKLQGRR